MRTLPWISVRLLSGALCVAVAGAVASPAPGSTPDVAAGTTPSAAPGGTTDDAGLGNGLGRLVAGSKARRGPSGLRLDQGQLAIRDDAGRVLVHVTPRDDVDRAAYRRDVEGLGLVVQATDDEAGTLEGFLPLAQVRDVAALADTGTVAQALRPQVRAGSESARGAATSQGVAAQRIDRVQARGVDGRGITVGALSDSYDLATNTVTGEPLTVRAADDVASGDLPGPGNPRNDRPVVVLDDTASGLDEGRAMLQIVHDVAPAARLCFATASNGLVSFADNVRALADRDGPCAADVVTDDIIYLDEPMFSDSVLSDAIDDVAAAGTDYFSAAGNQGLQQAWQSPVRLLPADRAVQGTNLDLSDVPAELYSGGLQDMDTGRGTDVAQTIALGAEGGVLDVQWDDPVDADGAEIGDPVLTTTGEITAADPAPTTTFTATPDQVGSSVIVVADGVPSGSTDLVLSMTAPDGTTLGTVDTGSSPERLAARLTQAGDYTITVEGFDGDTGDYTLDVSPVEAPSTVTTDFNLLLFTPDGQYAGAVADDNLLSGRPSEISPVAGLPELQLVIARAGTGPVGATTLRHVLFGDAVLAEHVDPLAPATFGHSMAAGSSAVAAYDAFRPLLPEPFTSTGGDLPVYFDSSGERYRRPQVRRTPVVASSDGGNTTFFGSDTPRDADTLPNFFGTSAAAPHAAGIAALVLQRAGGPRSLRPSALRQRLQRSTYTHDLDPTHAEGSAGGLTVTADGAQGGENELDAGSMDDPRFFGVEYTGRVPLRSITFFGETASPTALGTRVPPLSDGIVFDPRPFDGATPFRADGFPFTVGSTGGGLRASDVSASFSVPGGGQSAPGQFRRMTVDFASGLRRGSSLRFGVDRDLAVSGLGTSSEGNGADELGGATFFPQRITNPVGLAFTATRTDGRTVRGFLRNRIGSGFTPVDGHGLVDAERAVLGR
ncbi:MAG: S8 family serine peptidase [Nocardioidaceae bacterium]|nr:S8 family serine peptidase [Nocardioidaceae bacterium]